MTFNTPVHLSVNMLVFVDGPIFLVQFPCQGCQVGLLGIVIGVQHGCRNNAGRWRSHERFPESVQRLHGPLHAIEFFFDGLISEIAQLIPGFRSVLHLAALRKPIHEHFNKLRKLLVVAAAPPLRLPSETRHALRHVRLETYSLLLAVVPDVDARLHLMLHDSPHRLASRPARHRLTQ